MSRSCDIMAAVRPIVGRNVSHSHTKTRKRFVPNIQNVTLPSAIMGTRVKLKLAASTIRTVAKHGGLDNLLLKVKKNKLTLLGIKMRRKLQNLSVAKAPVQ